MSLHKQWGQHSRTTMHWVWVYQCCLLDVGTSHGVKLGSYCGLPVIALCRFTWMDTNISSWLDSGAACVKFGMVTDLKTMDLKDVCVVESLESSMAWIRCLRVLDWQTSAKWSNFLPKKHLWPCAEHSANALWGRPQYLQVLIPPGGLKGGDAWYGGG